MVASFGRTRRQTSMLFKKKFEPLYQNNVIVETHSHAYRHFLKETKDTVHKDHPKSGGPFESRLAKITFFDETAPRCGALQWGNFTGINSGPVRCTYSLPSSLTLPASNFNYAESLGPTAWAKFRPAKPDISLGVFLAELRDLPAMMFSKLTKFRSLGSNYLAVQFGWKPFLSDLYSWYESIIQIDKRISQLIRDNGKWVRRGGNLFRKEDETCDIIKTYPWAIYPNYNSYLFSSQVNVITRKIEEAWFSGSFRYYIPGLRNSFWGKAEGLLKNWGLNMSPADLWQLTPFSWLVDWFSNVGHVIGNYSASMQDHLTAKYAYLMYTTRIATEVLTIGKAYFLEDRGTYPYSYWVGTTTPFDGPGYEYVLSTQVRAEASPFGFQFTFDTMSPYQISILSALGISYLKY